MIYSPYIMLQKLFSTTRLLLQVEMTKFTIQLTTLSKCMYFVGTSKFGVDVPRVSKLADRTFELSWTPRLPSPSRASYLSRDLSYTVEYRGKSTDWTPLKTGLRESRYILRDVEPDRDYMYRVRAESKYGPSEPSTPISMMTYLRDSKFIEHLCTITDSMLSSLVLIFYIVVPLLSGCCKYKI